MTALYSGNTQTQRPGARPGNGGGMKLIKKSIIDGKEARLVLLDDNKTVRILYDNKTIFSAANDIWENIKDEEWAQYALIKIEAEKYARRKKAKDRLKRLAEEVF